MANKSRTPRVPTITQLPTPERKPLRETIPPDFRETLTCDNWFDHTNVTDYKDECPFKPGDFVDVKRSVSPDDMFEIGKLERRLQGTVADQFANGIAQATFTVVDWGGDSFLGRNPHLIEGHREDGSPIVAAPSVEACRKLDSLDLVAILEFEADFYLIHRRQPKVPGLLLQCSRLLPEHSPALPHIFEALKALGEPVLDPESGEALSQEERDLAAEEFHGESAGVG